MTSVTSQWELPLVLIGPQLGNQGACHDFQ